MARLSWWFMAQPRESASLICEVVQSWEVVAVVSSVPYRLPAGYWRVVVLSCTVPLPFNIEFSLDCS